MSAVKPAAPAPARGALDPSRRAFYHELLRHMLLVRYFEEKAGEAYAQGSIGGFCHLYIGQEAVAVGSLAALRPDDYVFAGYREHAHALVRGTSARAVMAELFGKATGCSRGKGGSMHLFDVERNFLGGHAIVGSHIPLAAGAAFACKYRGTDQVSVCYFGEAAANIGAFHETLNMAALWKLPGIFICENNRYGMGTALERASAVYDIYQRACAYHMAAETVDGMDVLAMYEATRRAVERARAEQLPTLIEARTYRYMGHSMADPIHGHYRTKEELEEQKQRDPIAALRARLQEADLLTDAQYAEMERGVHAEVDDALAFAAQSPDPEPAELYADVYQE
ncbi:MAG TPA: pyruvate dehydrogenase (acetyl-transferring) E1 component subunit alpha [Gemmatimonadales bacterium]|nr:pyruvate dehydrogenase (acetyl-transferring) E1 component subunit alpha [Gemmatimonadales bacterium]